MRVRNLSIAAVVAALSWSAQVGAQPEPAAGASTVDTAAFNTLDLDHDGFISREEASGTNLQNRFDALDLNHDGKLSPSEANASAAASGASRDAGQSTAPASESPQQPVEYTL